VINVRLTKPVAFAIIRNMANQANMTNGHFLDSLQITIWNGVMQMKNLKGEEQKYKFLGKRLPEDSEGMEYEDYKIFIQETKQFLKESRERAGRS
jgi:hypothetical protein